MFFTGIHRLRNSSGFDSIIIEIDENKIWRGGNNDFRKTTIEFSEIGKLIDTSEGLGIIKKGFWNTFNYYTGKYALMADENIIFIPVFLQNYPLVKSTIINTVKENSHKTF